MNATLTFSAAQPSDRTALIKLLQSAALPIEDLPHSLESFILAKEDGHVVGSVGVELYGTTALLRSLAVTATKQGTGLGKYLVEQAMQLAFQHGVQAVYLITTTATGFFQNQGFTLVDRTQVPASIRQTAQFTGICPSSAMVLCKKR
jgi:amino-acid N-acetyltransferase